MKAKTYHKLLDAAKSVIRRNFIFFNSCIRNKKGGEKSNKKGVKSMTQISTLRGQEEDPKKVMERKYEK